MAVRALPETTEGECSTEVGQAMQVACMRLSNCVENCHAVAWRTVLVYVESRMVRYQRSMCLCHSSLLALCGAWVCVCGLNGLTRAGHKSACLLLCVLPLCAGCQADEHPPATPCALSPRQALRTPHRFNARHSQAADSPVLPSR